MKKIATLLFSACLLLAPGHARSQAVESQPLDPFKPYTLSTETDPMAMDAPPASPGTAPEAIMAPPPPGQDSIQAAESMPQSIIAPAQDSMPASTQNLAPPPDYPNNNVSGVIPEDPSKYANRIFCTFKISFDSTGNGTDANTSEKVKRYLDSNTEKLTYVRSDKGGNGEYSYCVKVNDHKNQSDIYRALKKFVRDSNPKTSVSLAGKGFTPVTNAKPRYQN